MYVDDAASAYLTVLEKGRPGEIYNIGTDFRTSIKELSETIIRKVANISDLFPQIFMRGLSEPVLLRTLEMYMWVKCIYRKT